MQFSPIIRGVRRLDRCANPARTTSALSESPMPLDFTASSSHSPRSGTRVSRTSPDSHGAKSKQKTADATGLASWIAANRTSSGEGQPHVTVLGLGGSNRLKEHGYKFVKAGFIAPWFGYEQKEKLTPTQSLAITMVWLRWAGRLLQATSTRIFPYHWEQEFAVDRSDPRH